MIEINQLHETNNNKIVINIRQCHRHGYTVDYNWFPTFVQASIMPCDSAVNQIILVDIIIFR